MLHLVIYYETSDGKRFAIARDIPYHYNLASIAQYVDETGIAVSAMSAMKTKRNAVKTAIFSNDNYKRQGILYVP